MIYFRSILTIFYICKSVNWFDGNSWLRSHVINYELFRTVTKTFSPKIYATNYLIANKLLKLPKR